MTGEFNDLTGIVDCLIALQRTVVLEGSSRRMAVRITRGYVKSCRAVARDRSDPLGRRAAAPTAAGRPQGPTPPDRERGEPLSPPSPPPGEPRNRPTRDVRRAAMRAPDRGPVPLERTSRVRDSACSALT